VRDLDDEEMNKSPFDKDRTDMTKVEILGENRFETYTKTRDASRAVVVRDGMILLIHETGSDLWIVPGGGIEEDETPEKCCIREAEEETGNLILPLQEFTVLFEYYEEYCYITHYFICEVTGSGRMHLTEAEVHRGAEPKWIPLPEAMEIFSRHQSYADVSEEKRGIYLREFTALQEYLKTQPKNTCIL
jgi:ADP-ribose pyrophosphatase YjhB (NUDIX family)